jgi:hypothetical protein
MVNWPYSVSFFSSTALDWKSLISNLNFECGSGSSGRVEQGSERIQGSNHRYDIDLELLLAGALLLEGGLDLGEAGLHFGGHARQPTHPLLQLLHGSPPAILFSKAEKK